MIDQLVDKDYLAKGISIVDTEVGKVQQIIDDYVDYAAMQLGFFAAEKANEIQKEKQKMGSYNIQHYEPEYIPEGFVEHLIKEANQYAGKSIDLK